MKTLNGKSLTVMITLFAFLFVGVAIAEKKDVEKKNQTECPVMSGKINKDQYVDYQGQRIYLCCAGCKGVFKKDPEKYMKKFEDENILLESVQKVCPVTEKPVKKEIYKDYKGRRVHFCCSGCIAQFDKDPEKYLNKLDEETKKGKEKGHDKNNH